MQPKRCWATFKNLLTLCDFRKAFFRKKEKETLHGYKEKRVPWKGQFKRKKIIS
jgi:hypothetical protein